MKTQLEALKEKVITLKGSARAVVERKIAELETKQFETTAKDYTLTELIEQSSVLVDELELSLANLENRLTSVMPTLAQSLSAYSTPKSPSAIASVIETNRTLSSVISRINSITEQIRL